MRRLERGATGHARMPANCQNSSATRPRGAGSRARRDAAMAAPDRMETAMDTERPDPNAELHARERLRIVFALGSLLLGLLAAAHA